MSNSEQIIDTSEVLNQCSNSEPRKDSPKSHKPSKKSKKHRRESSNHDETSKKHKSHKKDILKTDNGTAHSSKDQQDDTECTKTKSHSSKKHRKHHEVENNAITDPPKIPDSENDKAICASESQIATEIPEKKIRQSQPQSQFTNHSTGTNSSESVCSSGREKPENKTSRGSDDYSVSAQDRVHSPHQQHDIQSSSRPSRVVHRYKATYKRADSQSDDDSGRHRYHSSSSNRRNRRRGSRDRNYSRRSPSSSHRSYRHYRRRSRSYHRRSDTPSPPSHRRRREDESRDDDNYRRTKRIRSRSPGDDRHSRSKNSDKFKSRDLPVSDQKRGGVELPLIEYSQVSPEPDNRPESRTSESQKRYSGSRSRSRSSHNHHNDHHRSHRHRDTVSPSRHQSKSTPPGGINSPSIKLINLITLLTGSNGCTIDVSDDELDLQLLDPPAKVPVDGQPLSALQPSTSSPLPSDNQPLDESIKLPPDGDVGVASNTDHPVESEDLMQKLSDRINRRMLERETWNAEDEVLTSSSSSSSSGPEDAKQLVEPLDLEAASSKSQHPLLLMTLGSVKRPAVVSADACWSRLLDDDVQRPSQLTAETVDDEDADWYRPALCCHDFKLSTLRQRACGWRAIKLNGLALKHLSQDTRRLIERQLVEQDSNNSDELPIPSPTMLPYHLTVTNPSQGSSKLFCQQDDFELRKRLLDLTC